MRFDSTEGKHFQATLFCVCVYMCVHTCVCVHRYIHVSIYDCVCVYMCRHMCVCSYQAYDDQKCLI